MMNHLKKITLLSTLTLALLSGCFSKKNNEAQNAPASPTTPTAPATPAEPKEEVAGSKLNDFFPKDEGDYDVVFTQEKEGTSQAKLKQGGKELAMLTIADITNDSRAKGDFASAAGKLNGYPVVAKGSKGTAVLVADRFQVQVRSIDNSFDEAMRRQWLQKFNLSGLAGMR